MQQKSTLIIFMGLKHSGKSSVGRMVARYFGFEYCDLDEIIADLARQRFSSLSALYDDAECVRFLYREQGKQVFQQLEAEAAGSVASQSIPTSAEAKTVLSLGGGTMENKSAMLAIQGKGLLIFLDTPQDILYERIIRGGIPAFLNPEKPRESFAELYEKRRSIALAAADITIDLGISNIDDAFENAQTLVKEYLNGRQ